MPIPRVPPQHNQGILARVCVPVSAASGNYTGSVALSATTADGHTVHVRVPIRLEVWDLHLPALGSDGTLGTSFRWGSPRSTWDSGWEHDCGVGEAWRVNSSQPWRPCEERDVWFSFLERHRISPDFYVNFPMPLPLYAEASKKARWVSALDVTVMQSPGIKANHSSDTSCGW